MRDETKKTSLNGLWVRVRCLPSCHVAWELVSTGFGVRASKAGGELLVWAGLASLNCLIFAGLCSVWKVGFFGLMLSVGKNGGVPSMIWGSSRCTICVPPMKPHTEARGYILSGTPSSSFESE